MTTKIGVIAEDNSDVDVINELVVKISNKEIAIRKFVGHGCGKLRRECHQWAQNLKGQGCSLLILLHDLDNNDLSQLRAQLSQALHPSPIRSNVIIIPVKEIEAWLLSDEIAIRAAMNLRVAVKRISNPESVGNPKEYLGRLVEQKSNGTKHYLNTVHNKRIAALLSLEKLRRCRSFAPLESFVTENLHR